MRQISLSIPTIKFERGELYLVAIIGIILQLGVLIYSGFATYYPTLKFPKDGHRVARYAFPCTAVGTLILVLGMLFCAHVVESSTKEARYQAGEEKSARLVWLQQTKTVNDQVFNSYAIFAENNRAFITTSTRKDKSSKSTKNLEDTDSKKPMADKNPRRPRAQ